MLEKIVKEEEHDPSRRKFIKNLNSLGTLFFIPKFIQDYFTTLTQEDPLKKINNYKATLEGKFEENELQDIANILDSFKEITGNMSKYELNIEKKEKQSIPIVVQLYEPNTIKILSKKQIPSMKQKNNN